MATIQEIARWVIESFDPTETTTVERICTAVLLCHGMEEYQAAEEASEKAQRVLALLRDMDPDKLPFEFSESHSRRLIGKQRPRKGDTPETLADRQGFSLAPEMLKSVYELGDCSFERLCAALMRLSGAKEAFARCANDDGGIDIYGRIPLRPSDDRVKAGILSTAILQKDLLMLGQCKCYAPKRPIEPDELRAFLGAVSDCLNQYDGSSKPPGHCVPKSYYRRGETCIPVFFTTSSFTDKAAEIARSNDITLVNGEQIAQFLIHHRIAITTHGDGSVGLEMAVLPPWIDSQLTTMPTSGSGSSHHHA